MAFFFTYSSFTGNIFRCGPKPRLIRTITMGLRSKYHMIFLLPKKTRAPLPPIGTPTGPSRLRWP